MERRYHFRWRGDLTEAFLWFPDVKLPLRHKKVRRARSEPSGETFKPAWSHLTKDRCHEPPEDCESSRTSSPRQLLTWSDFWNMKPISSALPATDKKTLKLCAQISRHGCNSQQENVKGKTFFFAKDLPGNVCAYQTSPAPVSIPAAATFAKKHKNKLFAITAVPMGTGPQRVCPLRHSCAQTVCKLTPQHAAHTE